MKKTLIALAALAATASFAQSTVTISGILDFAGASVSGTQAIAKGSTFSTTTGTSSTSVLRFIAVEDLGGGMKATAQYNFDPRTLSNDSLAVTNNTQGTAGASNQVGNTATGLARDELFVGISGGFGNLRLGSPNSIGLNSFQAASPLGTGIGSAYTGGGTAGTMTNSYVQTRYSRSVRYDSPVMNGFSASVLYAPGNDQAAVAASTTTSGGQSALLTPNAREATEFGLNYANGPLTVSYANIAQSAQTNPTGWYAVGTGNLVKTSMNLLNANYKFGAATTVYAGWYDGDALASTTSATKVEGYRLAVKQTVGAVDLVAQYTEQKTGATKTKSTVTGLRADYNLSKTAAVYLGYEDWDTGTAYANSTSTGTRKITAVGLRKSF